MHVCVELLLQGRAALDDLPAANGPLLITIFKCMSCAMIHIYGCMPCCNIFLLVLLPVGFRCRRSAPPVAAAGHVTKPETRSLNA